MPRPHPGIFELLFRQHSRELLAFASQRAGEAAEDLVQDAYVRYLEHGNPEIIENPRAYLYKVTANATIDHLRKQAVRDQHVGEIPDLDQVPCQQPSPEAETENMLLLQQCLAVLDTLPEIQRHVFLLQRIDGLSLGEIADALHISRRTVERHSAKAFAHCYAALRPDKP